MSAGAAAAGAAVVETVEVAGARLEAARIAGPAGAPTIVFLHEGLGCLSLWRDFPARLARAAGCGALAWSRRGYGRSAPLAGGFAPDYMHREALEVLPALLDRFGIAAPALYGHSDGASIALIHAGASGRPVRALVLEAPHVFVEPESVAGVRAAVAEWEAGGLRRRLERRHADAGGAFRAWSGAWLDPAFADWNIEALLPAVRAPVLAIQGEADAYGTPRQIDAIAAGLPGPCERLLLPGIGHGPHREAADRVLERAGAFLRRVLFPGQAAERAGAAGAAGAAAGRPMPASRR